jgi:hypothetical protein
VVGLHIGAKNVKQYFPRHLQLVELELDHLLIICGLEPSFWQDRPEIFDLRLSSWLEAKRRSGKLTSTKASLAMIPRGEHLFRLQMIPADVSDHSLLAKDGVAVVSQVVTTLAAFDRRKQNLGHTPERRRVARLKNNGTQALASPTLASPVPANSVPVHPAPVTSN